MFLLITKCIPWYRCTTVFKTIHLLQDNLSVSSLVFCSIRKRLFPVVYQLFATTWTEACQASLSFILSQGLGKRMSIESVILSNHLVLCCPLLLPSVFPSIRVFSNESALCIRWPKYWSFSFSISPSNEYSGLISFRIDWFDLFAVQGTLQFGTITKSCFEQSHTSFHVDMFHFFWDIQE